ncbi:MAG TPA: DUF192 domain-containing protein [Gemmatimonadaceae bacterium]|jgi:hypothetical protein
MNWIRRATLSIACLTVALFAACTSHADSDDTDRYAGIMAFDTATIRLIGQSSRDTTSVVAELAESEPQQTMGLMERRSLAPNAGMLFLYPKLQPDTSAFWMFRTRIPLDIAFVDSTGVIRTVLTMQPCASPLVQGCPDYPANAKYLAALEVNAGFFARQHLGVGDRLMLGDTTSRRRASHAGS